MSVFSDQLERIEKQANTFALQQESQLEATWTEIKNTAKRNTLLEGITSSERKAYYDYYAENLNKAGVQLDLEQMEHQKRVRRGEMLDSEKPGIRAIFEKYEEQVVKAGGQSLDDIDQMVKRDVLESRQASESADARSQDHFGRRFTANMAGGFRGALEDPAMLLTLPIGLQYKGGSLLSFAAREGAIQSGLASVEQVAANDANKQWLDRIGLDQERGMEELLQVAGAAGAISFGMALIGGRFTRGRANKAVEELRSAAAAGREAEGWAVDLVKRELESGYRFDTGQMAVLNKYVSEARDSASMLGGKGMHEQHTVKEAASEMQARARGDEGAPARAGGKADEVETDLGQNRPNDPMRLREKELRQRIEKRLEIERDPGKKSKPLKKLERELADVRQKIADGEVKADAALKRAEAAVASRTAAMQEIMELEYRYGRDARHKRAAADGAKRRVQEAREARDLAERRTSGEIKGSARKKAALRKQAERLRERANEAEANASRLETEAQQAQQLAQEMKREMERVAREKRVAERALNDLAATKEGVDELNKGTFGYKLKVPKTDKGEPRPAKDIIDPPGGARLADESRPERSATDEGAPDEVAERVAAERADELVDRVDADPESELGRLQAEYKATRQSIEGLKRAIACARGGE